MNSETIPEFKGTNLQIAEQIVIWANNKIKKVRWTNEEIDRNFGKRSAVQTLEEGNTFYMGPCLDFNLVFSFLMRKQDIPHQLVIEEQYPTRNFPFNRLHFVTEFQNRGEITYIDNEKMNITKIGRGYYIRHSTNPQAQIIRVPSWAIEPNKPLHEIFGFRSVEDLEKTFKGYSSKVQIERMKKDNNEENWNRYVEATKNGPKICPD